MRLAGRLDLSTVAVHYHVTMLLAKKLIRRERVGMSYRYSSAAGKDSPEDGSVEPMVPPS